jgi:hypothetical protein
MISENPNVPHGDGADADAVDQLRHAEAVARDPGIHVGADQPDQQAQHDHRDRLDERAVREHDRGDEAQHHQREVVRGAELEGELRERRRERGDEERCHAAREERRERRDAERLPGLALARPSGSRPGR